MGFSNIFSYSLMLSVWFVVMDNFRSFFIISHLLMFGGAMGLGCLVELSDLDVWWSYVLWMFGGAMGLGCLVELWALEV
jgi:hypothetical protein